MFLFGLIVLILEHGLKDEIGQQREDVNAMFGLKSRELILDQELEILIGDYDYEVMEMGSWGLYL